VDAEVAAADEADTAVAAVDDTKSNARQTSVVSVRFRR
jgi:hypothetical protein